MMSLSGQFNYVYCLLMLLYDPQTVVNYRDYGIMLPVPPDREKKVLEFLKGDFHPVNMSDAVKFLEKENPALKAKLPAIDREDLERIHSRDYIKELYGEGLKTALFKTFELLDAEGRPSRYEPDRAIKPLSDLFQTLIKQAGGTYLTCLLALASNKNHAGFCFYLGGGTHHARYDAGSGFCLINDIAVAAIKILSEKHARQIWIIDLDAHKGDGTAELISFARKRGELQQPGTWAKAQESDNSKPGILTLSIHMAEGWPLNKENILSAEKGRAPLLSCDVDIGIDSGEEASYTGRLAQGIRELESLSVRTPDLAIVVDGADPYEHDSLPSSGLMHLTLEQCLERDTYVYRCLRDRGIPSAWLQSGGYGERAWEPQAHFLKRISKPETDSK